MTGAKQAAVPPVSPGQLVCIRSPSQTSTRAPSLHPGLPAGARDDGRRPGGAPGHQPPGPLPAHPAAAARAAPGRRAGARARATRRCLLLRPARCCTRLLWVLRRVLHGSPQALPDSFSRLSCAGRPPAHPTPQAGRPSRVVNVASKLHFMGALSRTDPHLADRYTSLGAYAQSKLAQARWVWGRECLGLAVQQGQRRRRVGAGTQRAHMGGAPVSWPAVAVWSPNLRANAMPSAPCHSQPPFPFGLPGGLCRGAAAARRCRRRRCGAAPLAAQRGAAPGRGADRRRAQPAGPAAGRVPRAAAGHPAHAGTGCARLPGAGLLLGVGRLGMYWPRAPCCSCLTYSWACLEYLPTHFLCVNTPHMHVCPRRRAVQRVLRHQRRPGGRQAGGRRHVLRLQLRAHRGRQVSRV